MEHEGAVAVEHLVQVGHLGEVVVHALDGYHGLVLAADDEGMVFQRLHVGLNAGIGFQGGEARVVGRHGLALGRHDFQLGVDGREERGHEVLEAVEHGHGADQGHRGYGHAADGNRGDDVDGMVRFLGEEVAAGDVEGEVHSFSNWSMCSM